MFNNWWDDWEGIEKTLELDIANEEYLIDII